MADLGWYLASDGASYIHGVTYNIESGKTRNLKLKEMHINSYI